MAFEKVGMQAVLKDAGKYLTQANAITASNERITGSIKKTTSVSQKFGKILGVAAKAGAVGVAVGIGLATKTFIDFDSAMTKSIAIMGDVSDALREDMEDAARDVAKTTTFSMTQAADSYFFLASAGLDAKQSIEALPLVSRFAQAGAFDMARATDLLTDAQSALGLTIRNNVVKNMENMARVSDVLVKANTLANATVEQFSESLTNRAGAALKIVNKDLEEGVAVLAAFADQGVKGAEAGTRLDIVLRDLQNANIRNREEFERLGIEIFDSSGKLLNMAEIIGGLEDALEGMSDEQLRATLTQLGFQDRSVSSLLTLVGLSDQIAVYEAELRKAGGTTDEVAEKQLTSLAAQFSLIQSAITDLLFVIGREFEPALRSFAAFLRERLIPAIERELPRAIDKAKELFEDWRPVIEGTGKAIRDIFEFLITNKQVIVATLTAIGVAMILAFPHVAIAVAAVAIIGSIKLLTANLDDLSISALQARLENEKLILSFFAGANSLVQFVGDALILPGLYREITGDAGRLAKETEKWEKITDDTRLAIIDQTVALSAANSEYNEAQREIIETAQAQADLTGWTKELIVATQAAIDAAATQTSGLQALAIAARAAGGSYEDFIRKLIVGAQITAKTRALEEAFIGGASQAALQVRIAGLKELQEQFEQIGEVIENIPPPVILPPTITGAIEEAEEEIEEVAARVGRSFGETFEEAFADAISDLPSVVARVLGEIGRVAGGVTVESAEEAIKRAELRLAEAGILEAAEKERESRLADIIALEDTLARTRELGARVVTELEGELASIRKASAEQIGELEDQLAAIERQRRRILGAPEPVDPVDVSDLVGTLEDAEDRLEQFRQIQRRAGETGNTQLLGQATEGLREQQRIIDETKAAIAERLDAEKARIEAEIAQREAEFARNESLLQREIALQLEANAAVEARIQGEIDALEALRGPAEEKLKAIRDEIAALDDLSTQRGLELDLLLARIEASNNLLKTDAEITAILEKEVERVDDLTKVLLTLDVATVDATDALLLFQLRVADLAQELLAALALARRPAIGAGLAAALFSAPAFHQGGIVPGSPGQQVPAILRAGELVLPAIGAASIASAPMAPMLGAGLPADMMGNTFNTEVHTHDSRPATIANAVRMVDMEQASRMRSILSRGIR